MRLTYSTMYLKMSESVKRDVHGRRGRIREACLYEGHIFNRFHMFILSGSAVIALLHCFALNALNNVLSRGD